MLRAMNAGRGAFPNRPARVTLAPMFHAALLVLALLAPAPPAATPRKPAAPQLASQRVKGVPLIEVPAQASGGDEMALLLSGDGGWAVTDKGIAERLTKGGIPVVGWNALRYFIRRKKPDRVARDLERVLRVYLPLWHKEKVILIGYSFGADVMPFLVNRLPPELAQKVSLTVLVSPTGTADFHFHPSEWLRKPSDDSLPMLPELEKLGGREILCAYGQKEKDSFCLRIPGGLVDLLIRPGGHIVGKDYGPIADWILARGPS
jgi:type IV secretory pathway VirJ component